MSDCLLILIYALLFSFSLAFNNSPSMRNLNRQNRAESQNNNVLSKSEVVLKVYYESLCPGSTDFFVKQLEPAVHALGSAIKVMMYPYGNAMTKNNHGTYKFTCQHGPLECYGNKLHACAIDIIKNNTKAVFYNACLLKYSVNQEGFMIDFSTALNWCGYKYDVPIRKVWKCANSKRGVNLLKHFGQETMKLSIRYVPYVALEGSTDTQDKAIVYLMGAICPMLEHPPQICKAHIYRRPYNTLT